MDLNLAFNVLTGVVCSILGYVIRTVWENQQKITRDLQDIENKLNESFVRKDDLHFIMEQIFSRFDRLESRLEHFFNHKGNH